MEQPSPDLSKYGLREAAFADKAVFTPEITMAHLDAVVDYLEKQDLIGYEPLSFLGQITLTKKRSLILGEMCGPCDVLKRFSGKLWPYLAIRASR